MDHSTKILVAAVKCHQGDLNVQSTPATKLRGPLLTISKIDWTKFAAMAGYSNEASAKANFYKVKKKLGLGGGAVKQEEPKGVKKATGSKKGKKRAATPDDDDDEGVDEDAQDVKRVKTEAGADEAGEEAEPDDD